MGNDGANSGGRTERGQTLTPALDRSHAAAGTQGTEDGGSDVISLILSSLDEAKAEDVLNIDIRGKSVLADAMIIASGRSSRHVASVCDRLLRDLKNAGFGSPVVEGLEHGDWVLIDEGDVIIHVFRPEVREFYNLERMWLTSDEERSDGTVH